MSPEPVIKIGLCGFGTVGQGVWKHLGRSRAELSQRLGARLEISRVAVRDLRIRRDREPFVHRAAFIGLVMAEGDPAQPLGRHDAAERIVVERKHLAQAGVEHQRLVTEDEKLIEGEAGRRGDARDEGREAINSVCNFSNLRVHGHLQGSRVEGDCIPISGYGCV